MAKVVSFELARARSHSVNARQTGRLYGLVDKEEVFLDYVTEWRGAPAIVTMHLSRSRGGMWDAGDDVSKFTWGTWHAYGNEARTKTDDPGGYGAHLTETARSRLADLVRDHALAWTETEEYRESERDAYKWYCRNSLREERGYGDPPSRDTRRRVELCADKLRSEDIVTLLHACDLFDAYHAALEAIK